ncbi:MAG: urease accessory protein UreE [Pseudomonadota bacterium]
MTPTATQVLAAGARTADATVSLDYHHRHRRRLMLETDQGVAFLLDLADARALAGGDLLLLDNGDCVEVVAVPEQVMRITAADVHTLMRLAWHIGNRHLAAELHSDHIVIADDHVIGEMVEGLGGRVMRVQQPFQPERGAYDHGH